MTIYPETARTRKIVMASLSALRIGVNECTEKAEITELETSGSLDLTVTGDGRRIANSGRGFGMGRAAIGGAVPEALESCIDEHVMIFAERVIEVGHERIEVFVKLRPDGPER